MKRKNLGKVLIWKDGQRLDTSCIVTYNFENFDKSCMWNKRDGCGYVVFLEQKPRTRKPKSMRRSK